jgi:hypothetical protein
MSNKHHFAETDALREVNPRSDVERVLACYAPITTASDPSPQQTILLHVANVVHPRIADDSGIASVCQCSGDADIAWGIEMPEEANVGLEVDGTIDIEKIDSVLQVGRPVHGTHNTGIPLFKIDSNGADAVRVYVELGRASVTTVEVLAGLKEGDRVILSDMSQFEKADRVHLTDEKHVRKQ